MATKKTKAAAAKIAPQMAWDILWRNYIAALKKPQTGVNLDRVERLKRQIDSFDQRWLGLPSRDDLQKVAARIVADAEKTGGPAAIRKLATFGWPHDQPLKGDSYELRNAIQDEAKRLEARL